MGRCVTSISPLSASERCFLQGHLDHPVLAHDYGVLRGRSCESSISVGPKFEHLDTKAARADTCGEDAPLFGGASRRHHQAGVPELFSLEQRAIMTVVSNIPGGKGSGDLTDLVVALHHVRIPVTDAWASRDWYTTVLGLVPVLDLEEEGGVVGVVLRHPQGFVIGLHQDRVRATALRGFAVLGLTVDSSDRLSEVAARLTDLGISHGTPEEGHLGWYLDVPDPDGILIRFHTGAGPDAEEA